MVPVMQNPNNDQNNVLAEHKSKCGAVVNTCPILSLEVLSSASLPKGQAITLNSLGLFGAFTSEREKDQPGSGLDGFTFFGSMLHVYESANDGQP